LREARLKYEEAAKAFKATWGEHFESELTADPTFAIQRARDIEAQALSEYVRVLKSFSDLIIRGKLPPKMLEELGTGSVWVRPVQLWTRHAEWLAISHVVLMCSNRQSARQLFQGRRSRFRTTKSANNRNCLEIRCVSGHSD
jgi:hypothetical protein